jgi:hypothetical protein
MSSYKNNFRKIKIYYFNIFFNKKYFKKQTLKIKSGQISYGPHIVISQPPNLLIGSFINLLKIKSGLFVFMFLIKFENFLFFY